jgi:heme oxygenase
MTVLRSVTHEKHQQVEQLPFVQYLLKGNITKSDYIVYLAEMLSIYRQLETLAADVGLFDGLAELPRTANMQADLDELAPGHTTELCPSTKTYLDYLSMLHRSEKSHQLFAHVYVRHMGDLYGGKLISRVVPGSGRWYKFDNRSQLAQTFAQRVSVDLADEALTAFDHFGNIFTDLWTRVNTA